ncbi:MAG TPA: FAD-dependent oxidoreductase [Firmicutes bacterium]|nr:FAD-dependent oxidoreductase [Bacillota bacterium]
MGKVLVVGGGVAGLQAATDLVRLGSHQVWLVEKRSHVGGKLHDLERTFPSDDCSLCHLAPEGCFLCIKSPFPPAGFRGLRVLTETEVVEIKGEPGHYLAIVRHGQEKAQPLPEAFDAVILAPGCTEFDPTGLERLRYGLHPDVITASQYEDMLATGRLRRPSNQGPVTRVAWIQCVGARDTSLNRPLCSTVCCGYAIKEAAVTRVLSGGSTHTTLFAQDLRTSDFALDRYARQAIREHGIRVVHHRVHSVDVDEQAQLYIRYVDEGGTVSREPFDLVVLSAGLEPDPQASRLARNLGLETDPWGFCPSRPYGQPSPRGVFVAGSFSEPRDVSSSLLEASAAAAACATFLASLAPGLREPTPLGDRTPLRQSPAWEGTGEPGILICRCPYVPHGEQFLAELLPHLEQQPPDGCVPTDVAPIVKVVDGCLLQGQGEELRSFAVRHRQVVLGACSSRACEAAAQAILPAGWGGSLRVATLLAMTGEEGTLSPLPLERALGALRASVALLPTLPAHNASPVDSAAAHTGHPLPASPAAGERAGNPMPGSSVAAESVLVIGGGAAGLSCVLALADLGVMCHLVEKENILGGQMLTTGTGALTPDLRHQLQELVGRVCGHPGVSIYLGSRVARAQRRAKDWQVVLVPATAGASAAQETPTISHLLSCRALVIATGGEAFPLATCAADNVLTLSQLEEMVASGIPLGTDRAGSGPVVIVLCTGDAPPGYCSKVCCRQAVRCGLALKSRRPDTDVLILFRDMRTPGRAELEYNEARRQGVRFVRLQAGSPPQLHWQEPQQGSEPTAGSTPRLALTYLDPILDENVTVFPALLALASPVGPARDIQQLAATLQVPLDEDGFVQLRHSKVRPVETQVPGVFACGSATGPATVQEAFVQGLATATRVATLLRERRFSPRVASITGACSACLTCLRVCRVGAVRLEGRKPVIDAVTCQGCGICAAECPAQAIVLSSSGIDELEAEITALLAEQNRVAKQGRVAEQGRMVGPSRHPLLVFACSHCASTAVERASLSFPSDTRVIQVPCVGTVDETLMLKALALGARGLVLAGCREGQCYYGSGPQRARMRAHRVNDILLLAGNESLRVTVVEVTPDRAWVLAETLQAMSTAAETKVYAGAE